MRMLVANLPVREGDDRTSLFFEHLYTEIEARGGLGTHQVTFHRTKNNSIPYENGRERLGYEIFLAMVHELQCIERVTAIIRIALIATWPEKQGLQVVELLGPKNNNMSLIRGDK